MFHSDYYIPKVKSILFHGFCLRILSLVITVRTYIKVPFGCYLSCYYSVNYFPKNPIYYIFHLKYAILLKILQIHVYLPCCIH